jgi:hypothetical protein
MMPEFIVGALLGAFLSTSWQMVPEGAWGMTIVCGLAVYFLSCAVFPFRACPWCKGDLRRDDGRGNFRIKSCAVCGGGRYVRFGARLMGRG